METCRMCGIVTPPVREAASDPANEMIWDTPGFVVVPSIGALLEGHLLVVSKRHALCSAELRNEQGALAVTLDRVRRVVRERYGFAVTFEHGPSAPGQAVGCSVDHAHVHVLPFADDIEHMMRRLDPRLEWRQVRSIADARPAFDAGLPYLYVRTDDGHHFVAADAAIPSQFFRRVITGSGANGGAFDWRVNPRADLVRATLASLRSAFDVGDDSCVKMSEALLRSA